MCDCPVVTVDQLKPGDMFHTFDPDNAFHTKQFVWIVLAANLKKLEGQSLACTRITNANKRLNIAFSAYKGYDIRVNFVSPETLREMV